MKKIVLGLLFCIFNIKSMRHELYQDCIVPLTIRTHYEIVNGTMHLKQSFETSNVMIAIDYAADQMNIKYKKTSLTIPSVHNLFEIALETIKESSGNKSQFIEQYERNSVVSITEYAKAPGLGFLTLYRAIEFYSK